MAELCTVSGTIYRQEGDSAPAALQLMTVKRVVQAGALYSSLPVLVRTDENGQITFRLPQGSVVYIQGDVEGFDVDGGVALQIPETLTADLASLVTVTLTPATFGNPMTGLGDLIYGGNSSGLATRLAPGNEGEMLSIVDGLPAWVEGGGGGATTFNGLSDVTITSPASGQVARYSGTEWVNAVIAAADLPTGIDATKIGAGAVSNTEFGYLDGVTSAIQTQLAGKQASLGYTAENAANKDQNSGYAGLDSSGKINPSQLPAIAISSYLGSVASQAAMLALTGQEGDWAIRSDTGTTWIIVGADPTQLSSWQQLATPTDLVSSVFGRTGAVTAQSNDYTFAQLASKPTTLSGYGITDAQSFSQSLADIAALADPNADRLLFWDDSAGAYKHLSLGTNLSITGTTLDAAGGSSTPGGSSGDIQYNNAGAFAGSILKQNGTSNIGLGGVTSSFPGLKARSGTSQLQLTDGTGSGSQGLLWAGRIYMNATVDSFSGYPLILDADSNNAIQLGSGAFISFASATQADNGKDVGIKRAAAGVIEINSSSGGTYRDILTRGLRSNAVAFASAIAAPVEGTLQAFTDSSTATWGATITGGGSNHVLGYYNGTNWTVAAK